MQLDELILLLGVVLQGAGLGVALKMAENGSHMLTIVMVLLVMYMVLQVLAVVIAKPDKKASTDWFGGLVAAVAWLPVVSLVYVLLGIWATKRQPAVFGSAALQYGIPVAVVIMFYLALIPSSALTKNVKK